jgi:hypothetical protein
MESFEEGMRLFHARKFQQAREFFLGPMGGPDRAVTHRAGLHARMCEQRLESAGLVLNTPEEHYNYAITLINSRDLAGGSKAPAGRSGCGFHRRPCALCPGRLPKPGWRFAALMRT